MKPNRFVLLLLVLALSLIACLEGTPTTTPDVDVTETSLPADDYTPIDLQAGYGLMGPWFELYFTNPDSPLSPQGTGGVDEPLVEALDAARLSIDMAAYSITLNSVRYALIRAHERGVTVRVVMEADNMDSSDVEALLEAGILIVGDEQEGLMHDKFVVIDRSEAFFRPNWRKIIWLNSTKCSRRKSLVRMSIRRPQIRI
jgi:phosphatidylserine/phosphatidylglycerophosphate/cardiolipin synthase-like enzyme